MEKRNVSNQEWKVNSPPAFGVAPLSLLDDEGDLTLALYSAMQLPFTTAV